MTNDGVLLITMGSGEWERTEENFHGEKCFGIING